MWSSLALAAAVAWLPAQAGLQLNNTRLTIGELGSTRPDSKVLPGEILFIAYDIDGITIDPQGAVKYAMAMEVANAAGKKVLSLDPKETGDFVPLRGNKVPARTFVTVGPDQEPGHYTCKVTVTDLANKLTATLTQKFEVLKKDFGVVAVNATYDDRGMLSAPTTGQVGQMLFIHFVAVGFARDPKSRQPNLEFEYQVADEAGQPTLPQPPKDTVGSGVKEDDPGLAHPPFPLYLNRPGKFALKIKVTDKVANRTTTYELPVVVQAAR